MSDLSRYWIWFVIAFGAGNPKIWSIIDRFEDVKTAYEALCSGSFKNLTDKEKKNISVTHIEQCDSIIEYCEKRNYGIITYDHKDYPPMLKNIDNPPAVLFCMGDLNNVNSKIGITVVGTRKPSQYSVNVGDKICSELVKRGFSIISGFALGIDSVAHKAALKNHGCTVAVLGCGIDYDYPKPNSGAKSAVAKRGAVITEFLPGTRPDGKNFPIRNRIIAGLGIGTLVIEGAERSGSLITAEHAIEQGKELFCIPPADIFDKRYAGVIKYLREGAIPVFSHLDILYEYYTSYAHKISSPELMVEPSKSMIFDEEKKTIDRKQKKRTSAPENENKDDRVTEYEGLSEEQMKIVEFLKGGEKHADEISDMLGMDTFEVLSMLTELEMLGIVRALFGKKFVLL